MNPNINILFYSRNCDTCKNLIKILQNENLLGYFRLFCVDDRLDQIPKHITQVPTMIVSNVNKPLVSGETFEWVKNIKFIKQKFVMDMNKRTIQENLLNMAKNNVSGPLGFVDSEMAGLSDKYALQDEKIDQAFSHNYFGLGNETKNTIFTAPEQSKIDKQDQLKKIKDMEKNRKTQDEEFVGVMKQQQLKAIISSEQNQPRY